SASTDGPPATGTTAGGVSWPVSASMGKGTILSSSCRDTSREDDILCHPTRRVALGVTTCPYAQGGWHPATGSTLYATARAHPNPLDDALASSGRRCGHIESHPSSAV